MSPHEKPVESGMRRVWVTDAAGKVTMRDLPHAAVLARIESAEIDKLIRQCEAYEADAL